ncbi:GIY-YIG nuclease family protein [Nocardioides sp. NPDC101246]|uniref:GIY-YIG nuclease family protein n=1 Tax=Nocardioides sp. NPDC101246 TaxID=3364336 RepID=UPI003828C2A3
MPYMYILRCRDHMLYVGSTYDLERRIAEHNAGLGAEFTVRRLPVTLAYAEEHQTIDDAYRREKQIQGWSRAKREALIAGDFERLHDLSRRRGKRAP